MKNYILFIIVVLCIQSCLSKITVEQALNLIADLRANCLMQPVTKELPKDGKYCKRDFDIFWKCWPNTLPNTNVTSRCSWYQFQDGPLTRYCNENGTWQKITKRTFATCKLLPTDIFLQRREQTILEHEVLTQKQVDAERRERETRELERKISKYNRFIDISVCFFTFIILCIFIPLKNKRFVLHRFLILAIFLNDLFYISMQYYESYSKKSCSILSFFGEYTFLVVIFMMFCEGFYQFRQFYFVFVDNQRVWAYVAFAYSLPAILVFGIYVPLMWFDPPVKDFSACYGYINKHRYEYIIFAPAILLLMLNILITIYLMQLIVKKLQNDKTTHLYRLRKSARGLLVLLILLGGGYAFTFFGPEERWFQISRAVIQHSQGTLICIVQIWMSHHLIKALKEGFKKIAYKKQLNRDQQSKRDTMATNTNTYNVEEKRGSTQSSTSLFKFFRGSSSAEDVPTKKTTKKVVVKEEANGKTNMTYNTNDEVYHMETEVPTTFNKIDETKVSVQVNKKSNDVVDNVFVDDNNKDNEDVTIEKSRDGDVITGNDNKAFDDDSQ